MVPGFHLFPFRTEQLSPAAPMVLRNSGRVGSRRLSARVPSPDSPEKGLFFVPSIRYTVWFDCFDVMRKDKWELFFMNKKNIGSL